MIWFSLTLVASISAWVLQLNSISYFNFILSYSDIAGWITEKNKYKGLIFFKAINYAYIFIQIFWNNKIRVFLLYLSKMSIKKILVIYALCAFNYHINFICTYQNFLFWKCTGKFLGVFWREEEIWLGLIFRLMPSLTSNQS